MFTNRCRPNQTKQHPHRQPASRGSDRQREQTSASTSRGFIRDLHMCRLWRGVIKSLSYRSSRQATYTIQKQTKHMWKRSLRCVEGGFCTTTQYIILLLITPLPCLYTNVTAGRSVGLLFGTSIEASRSASSAFYIDPEISRKLQSEPGERRWIGIVLDRFIIIIIRGGGAV